MSGMTFDATMLFYSLISILLAMVAYFIKQLHSDFKRVEKDLSEVKTTTSLIKTEFKGINELMNQRFEFIEKRLSHVEYIIFKTRDYEKSKNESD